MPAKKYVVFKQSDWDEFTDWLADALRGESCPLPFELGDAEVIRKQDITAAPIFHHYASQLLTMAEMAASTFDVAGPEAQATLRRLREIADHFHEAAVDAEQWPVKKVPD